MTVSSLKKIKSQVILPTASEPNFLNIENQLREMENKL